jgi:concanavalin A-like lectin/glucanase superfamily protein
VPALLALALLLAMAGVAWAAFSGTTSNSGNTLSAASAFNGYRDQVMADSPRAYWRLGEAAGSGTATDETSNANNGTYTNGPTLAQTGALLEDSNKAVSFDGTNDFVNVPHSSSLNVGDTFTLEAWIKRGSTTADGAVIDKSGAYELNVTSNRVTLRVSGTADVAYSTRSISDTTRWHHLVATKSGGTVRLYLDGADVTGQVTNRTFVNSTNALAIGQSANFNGLIDEPAVYATALSEARVQAHYRVGRRYYGEVMADSPVGYWRLGEIAGRTPLAFDSKNTNHGTYSFSPTLGASGALMDSANTAVTFDGVDDYVQVPDANVLDTGDTFTLEAWVKRGTTGVASQTIFDKQSSAYVLRFMSDNKLYLRKSGTGDIVASTSAVTDTANWHHVTATKSGATVKLYVDGQDVTGTVSNQTISNNAQPLWVGKESGTSFNGTIDDAAVYPTALSLSRVQAHYEAGRPYHEEVERASPVSYWRMADGGETITHRGSQSAARTTAGTTLTINKPSGVVQNDVMIAAIEESGGTSGSITAPTGWNLIGTQIDGTFTKTYTYWKAAGASEGASYQWTSTLSGLHVGGIVALTNVDTTNPVDASASQANAASFSITCPSVTTTEPNDWLIAFPLANDGDTFTFPASMTERFDVRSGATTTDRSIAGGTEVLGAAGATGTRTITNDNPGGFAAPTSACLTVAIKPDGKIYDSRHANDGTYASSGVTQGASGALAVDDDPAVSLDGTNGQATVPDSNSLDVGDGPLTLEAWIKRSSTTTEDDIAGKGTNSFKFAIKTNKLTFSKQGVADIVQSTTNIADTNWHRVAATKNGPSVKLYMDGMDVTGTVTNQTLSNTTSQLVIGGSVGTGGSAFGGTIDEFAIYNSVLSADQIAQHYAEGVG